MDDTAPPYPSTQSVDVTERDVNGNTALSRAANKVELNTIKFLLEKGANVNAGCYNLSYRNGRRLNSFTTFEVSTPLMNVIANYMDYDESIKDVIKLMLEKGADVNSFDSGGNTAIDICFRKDDWRVLLDVILEYTTKNGIEIERKEYEIYGDEQYDKELYLYEKNIMRYNDNTFKYLLCSREQRDTNDKKLLGKMLELGINNFLKKSPEEKAKDDIIVCAAILEKPDAVEKLLKSGANVNVRFYRKDWSTWSSWVDYESSTALMCAAEKGNDKIVELLLSDKIWRFAPNGSSISDKNIDVNLKANNGLTALSYAIQGQNIKIVEMIGKKVKSGGDKNGLLMTVVKMFNEFQFNKSKSLQSFVKAVLSIDGVDVNFKNSEGQTALMYLVSKNTYNSDERIETILNTSEEIIKSKGFDLNAQDNDGKTALMFFIQKKPENNYDNFIVEKILKIKGVNVNLKDTRGQPALFYAVNTDNLLITENILKIKDVDVKVKDTSGKTALFYAKKPEMAELLLRYKIPVDEVDNYGKTALFYVPSKVIKSLKGANVNIKDKVGKTALCYIEGSWEPYSIDIERVKELLNLGADVNAKDNEGNTVVMDIIEKLDNERIDRSHELLGILMEILNKVPGLDISSFKNQKGYSVITFLFSIKLKLEMIKQVLEYCYNNLSQNENLFKNEDEVEYYINYIKNKKKEDKEFEDKEFESILQLLENFKNHVNARLGGKYATEAAIRFSQIALNAPDPQINYLSKTSKKQKTKFGGQPHRLQKRRSYALLAKRRSFDAKRRSRRKQVPFAAKPTTVRCSPSLKHP